jgi:hypothetical protein
LRKNNGLFAAQRLRSQDGLRVCDIVVDVVDFEMKCGHGDHVHVHICAIAGSQHDGTRSIGIRCAGIIGDRICHIQGRIRNNSRPWLSICDHSCDGILRIPGLRLHGEKISAGGKITEMEAALIVDAAAPPRLNRKLPVLHRFAKERNRAGAHRLSRLVSNGSKQRTGGFQTVDQTRGLFVRSNGDGCGVPFVLVKALGRKAPSLRQ